MKIASLSVVGWMTLTIFSSMMPICMRKNCWGKLTVGLQRKPHAARAGTLRGHSRPEPEMHESSVNDAKSLSISHESVAKLAGKTAPLSGGGVYFATPSLSFRGIEPIEDFHYIEINKKANPSVS